MPRDWRSKLKIAAITSSLIFCACIALGMRSYSDRHGSSISPAFYGVNRDVSTLPIGQRNAFIGRDDAFEPVAQTPPRGKLIVPVAGVKPQDLVDTFTQAREGGVRTHNAIDITAPRGTPVLAASAGLVEKLFLSEAGGKTIYIRSADRKWIYYYAHLDEYAPGLAEGMIVGRGQPIGTVGYSGNANPDAPHLHFEIMTASPHTKWSERISTLNPYPLLERAGSE